MPSPERLLPLSRKKVNSENEEDISRVTQRGDIVAYTYRDIYMWSCVKTCTLSSMLLSSRVLRLSQFTP